MQRAIGELRRPKAELTALAECGLKATIKVRFSLEDENAEEARLIGRAVVKAKANAEALAAACGKRLGDVRLVTYNRPTDEFAYPGDFCVSAPGSLPAVSAIFPTSTRSPSRSRAPWTWTGIWSRSTSTIRV